MIGLSGSAVTGGFIKTGYVASKGITPHVSNEIVAMQQTAEDRQIFALRALDGRLGRAAW